MQQQILEMVEQLAQEASLRSVPLKKGNVNTQMKQIKEILDRHAGTIR